jgi:hypothetical protein
LDLSRNVSAVERREKNVVWLDEERENEGVDVEWKGRKASKTVGVRETA